MSDLTGSAQLSVGSEPARGTVAGVCSRCRGTDSVGPLPRRFACTSCGQRGLCYACNVNHNLWCGKALPPCTRHTQCIEADGHNGPCSVPAWSEVWQRD